MKTFVRTYQCIVRAFMFFSLCIISHQYAHGASSDSNIPHSINAYIGKPPQAGMLLNQGNADPKSKVDSYISDMASPKNSGVNNLLLFIDNTDTNTKSMIYSKIVEHLRSDADPKIRSACARCLVKYKYENKSSKELISVLRNDPDKTVRSAAASTLGIVGGQAELDELYNTVVHDKYYEAANEAAMSIGVIGGEKATDMLAKLLRSKSCPTSTIVAIGIAGHPKGIDILEDILKGNDQRIRGRAAFGMTELAARNKDNTLVVDKIRKIASGYAADKDGKVRENIAHVYGIIGTMDDIATLKTLLNDEYAEAKYYFEKNHYENGKEKQKIEYPVREKAHWAIEKIKARHEKAKSK